MFLVVKLAGDKLYGCCFLGEVDNMDIILIPKM